jgi:periplasmic protein TonB
MWGASDDLDLAATHGLRHMSLPAAATSGLIHALAALAFVWTVPAPRLPDLGERAIDVTFEQPEPEPAAPPPVEKPAPVAEQVLPAPAESPMLDTATEFPPPPAEPPATAPPQPEAIVASLEDVAPPVDEPPPFSTKELVRTRPAPAPAKPQPPRAASPKPVQQVHAVPVESERRAREDYLLAVVQKLSRYRFQSTARGAAPQGMVVTQLTLARDGRLLDVALARSSGYPELDRGVLDAVRQASPFPPLPADVAGPTVSLTVPIGFSRDR